MSTSKNTFFLEKTGRNELGQFHTPSGLAMDMVRYARQLVSTLESVRFLEPGFGDGAFYQALLNAFPVGQIDKAWGYEIDPRYQEAMEELRRGTPLQFEIADFLELSPPESNQDKANLLLCNPPYVRHQHLSLEEKQKLQLLVKKRNSIELNGMTGLYCYFILLSHQWLADGGTAGWLIPSEFMDVNYGSSIRQYLTEQVRLLHIHRFAPDEMQFSDALVTSSIVWFTKEPPFPYEMVKFSLGGTLLNPDFFTEITLGDLEKSDKWTQFLLPSSTRSHAVVKDSLPSLRLSDVFTVKRGLATGANKFFILTPEQVGKYNLPAEFLTPILPSPRYLHTKEIECDDDGMPNVKKKLLLLDCKLSEGQIEAEYPSLWSYLAIGRSKKIHERYLCSHRSPWYSQEKRAPSPFLCTYMGRQRSEDQSTPFRFILNHSKALATNSYLLLYPKPELKCAIENDDHLLKSIWEFLVRIPFASLRSQGRVYGGALYKLEPKELANVPVDGLLRELPEGILHNEE